MNGCDIEAGRGVFGGRRLTFAALDSTNAWVLAHATELAHGDVVRAVRQTAGRGRLGRSWIAPDDRGLTVTFALRGAPGGLAPANVSQLAAVALADLLRAYGLVPALKWPNDVLVGGCKLAGLLAEGTPSGLLALGIGLNVNVRDADFSGAELLLPATSLAARSGREFDVAAVLGDLCVRFERAWARAAAGGFEAVRSAWAEADWLVGRRVRLLRSNGTVEGRYLGLDGEGRIVLEHADGSPVAYLSGDVQRLTS